MLVKATLVHWNPNESYFWPILGIWCCKLSDNTAVINTRRACCYTLQVHKRCCCWFPGVEVTVLVLEDVARSGRWAVELPTRMTVWIRRWFLVCLGSHPSHVELCYTGSIQLKRLTPHSTACFSAPDSVVLRYSRTRRQRGPPAKWRRKGTRDHAR